MLVYKDGITRTIEPREEEKYKELGYVEVQTKAPKVEEPEKEEDEAPKGKRR